MGTAIVWLLLALIQLMTILVVAGAVMSWLIAFNVVNPRNAFIYQVGRFLEAVTEPMLRPIRKIVPLLGGIDISPVILLLGLQFVDIVIKRNLAGPLIAALG